MFDLVLPKACILCEATGANCCERCTALIARSAARLACTGCGLYRQCECHLPHWQIDRTMLLSNYQAPIDKLITGIKFRNRMSDASTLGTMLGSTLSSVLIAASGKSLAPLAAQSIVIVPVPLSKARLRERGFNQAQTIAAAALNHLRHRHGLKIAFNPHLLERQSSGAAQSLLTRPERLGNVDHSYAVALQYIHTVPSHVLLIDDVMTSGATLNSCAAALRRAGATTIWAAVIARTQSNRTRLKPLPLTQLPSGND